MGVADKAVFISLCQPMPYSIHYLKHDHESR